MLIKKSRRNWLKLFKFATAICSKCGYDNPYMDPNPNYVCKGCKMLQEAWGDDAKKEVPEEAPTLKELPSTRPFSPWIMMEKVAHMFGKKIDQNTDVSVNFNPKGNLILINITDMFSVSMLSQELTKINDVKNIIEKYLGPPKKTITKSSIFSIHYMWNDLDSADLKGIYFELTIYRNGMKNASCQFYEKAYPKP